MECNVGGMDQGLRGVAAVPALSTASCARTERAVAHCAGGYWRDEHMQIKNRGGQC